MTSDPDEPNDEPPDEDAPEEEESPEEGSKPTGSFESLAKIGAAIGSLPAIDLQHLISPEALQAITDPLGPELRSLTQPQISPELIRQLQQPAIDPEVIRTLQSPMIDPDVMEAVQQPVIDEETLQTLSEPAINEELIQALESLNNSSFLRAYEAAAAIEQADEGSIEEIDEEDIEEDIEEPEEGGFLSTFFNIAAFYLFQRSEGLSEESLSHLTQTLQAESVQSKSNAFRNFVDSAKETASNIIITAGIFAFYATWALYFGDEMESADEESDDEDEGDEDDEEEDDE